MGKTKELDCYVEVTGEASKEEDEGVQGFYLVQIQLTRKVDPDALTPAEQSEIAKAVLDNFHDHQGIDNLEDFTIGVFLADGNEIEEEDDLLAANLVASASHGGKVDEEDLPFEAEDAPDVTSEPRG